MSGVNTIDCGDPSDFLWAESSLVNRIIMQASPLKDALSELDWWGSELMVEMSTSGNPTVPPLPPNPPQASCLST